MLKEFIKIQQDKILKMNNPLRDYSHILTCRAIKSGIVTQ